MDYRLFNLCVLVGWAMFTVGGVVLNVGWGVLAGGALMLVLTISAAVFFGIRGGKKPNAGEGA